MSHVVITLSAGISKHQFRVKQDLVNMPVLGEGGGAGGRGYHYSIYLYTTRYLGQYMCHWQSWIEIEYYSVAYFKRIKLGDVLEICDKIFDFYPGLPHI